MHFDLNVPGNYVLTQIEIKTIASTEDERVKILLKDHDEEGLKGTYFLDN